MATETGKSSNRPDDPPSEASRNKRAASGPEPSGLVAFTLDVGSGRIVKVESVEPGGGDRRELSAEQALQLATRSGTTLEDVLERTFEAGISSVLDDASFDEAEGEGEAETEAESDLRRAILRPMMERSAARHLLKREVLGRAILGTLIEDALASKTSAPKPSPSKTSTPSASATAPKPSPSASRPAGGSRSSRQPPRGRPH